MRKFDGITIYEMSEHQLRRTADAHMDDAELVKEIDRILAARYGLRKDAAKEKHRIAPEMECNYF